MTQDPLLALGVRWGGKKRTRERGGRRKKMKEICLEMIAHKAMSLGFNLTQCAQISY